MNRKTAGWVESSTPTKMGRDIRPPLIGFMLLLVSYSAYSADTDTTASMNVQHKSLLQEYCLKCHNAEKPEGKFRVDTLPFEIADNESAERWQKVLNALNSGSMPPADETQLPNGAKTDFLDDLTNVMTDVRRNLRDQHGIITMRRLNRREYGNSLRELLGVQIDVSELPADTGNGGFDTWGSNLFMSSDQFEQYHALGLEALAEAFERVAHASSNNKQRFEAEDVVDRVKINLANRIELRRKYNLWTKAIDAAADRPENRAIAAEIRKGLTNQPPWNFYHSWQKLKDVPSPTEFGFADGEHATHEGISAWNLLPYQAYFLSQPEVKNGAFLTIRDNGVNPLHYFGIGGWPPGDCIVRIRIAATKQATPARRFVEFGVQSTHLSTHEVSGTMDAPQVIEIPFNLTKSRGGSFFIREKGTFDSNEQGHRVFAEGEKQNGIGPEFALWVDWTEVERKMISEQQIPPGIRALGIPLGDDASAITKYDVRAALDRFITEACRGNSASATFLDKLVNIYDERRTTGTGHSSALRETLSIVLASPRFLYLIEQAGEQENRELGGLELASRLSFFLWGAPPDKLLRDLATSGELLKPAVLLAQMDRLIDDPRSTGFVIPFTHQWLGLDRLDFFRFNNVRYPAFDESTKMAARTEVYETVGYLLHQNESLRNLLKSDFIVINSLLAIYYGIEGVKGDAYQKVAVPNGLPRGGLIGMAAILAMGSNGEQTTPVERGAWVLRKLINDPPPPAPANVPQISRLQDKLLTTRERLRAHQEEAQCASCHRKIDPVGLALENFNAVGQWRTEDTYEAVGLGRKTWTIDPSGAFHHGPAFTTFFELRDVIASKSDAFARGFSIAVLEYALGRSRSFRDEPLIAQMVNQSRQKDFAMREFIKVLVGSNEFRSK
ncbi:MAG: DUF1592 domain-containing protein [Schlesneria sp.]